MVQRLKNSSALLASAALAVALSSCGIDFDPQHRLSIERLRGTTPKACPTVAIVCPAGQEQADVDGDGCPLECRPIAEDGGSACIEIAILCTEGEVPTDLDGDGCAFECAPVQDGGHCGGGLEDGGYTDADAGSPEDGGVYEEDGGVVCPEYYPVCADGEEVADVDGDGCALECQPITDGGVACPAIVVECFDRADPIDANGDGCALECPTGR